MESSSAPTRVESFPIGLRVLVVDDDLTWLKILDKMLRKCSYEVTTCCKARTALDLLREKKDKFDIVISDVNMPDMDGFKLLEHVGLEMDLPVIMMSVDGETTRVMKGVQHGACDYLLKPIRMKELRNIWQHVYRKRVHEVKEMESYDISDDTHLLRSGFENFDDRLFMSTSEITSSRKRKDAETGEMNDQDLNDFATVKKTRVVWSVDLHQKFVNAVDQIGFEKVGPKKILDLMNVPGLTRENIASHLQKYRLYLSRIQKNNETREFSGNIQPDNSPEDNSGSLCVQIPTTFHQNTGDNIYGYKSQKFQGKATIQGFQEKELNKPCLFPVKDQNEDITAEFHSQEANNAFQSGSPMHLEGILQHGKQHGSVVLRQFIQFPKHDHEPFSLLEDYSHPTQNREHQFSLWHLQCSPSLVSVCSSNEENETKFDVNPSKASRKNHFMKILSKEFEGTHEHKLICSKEHHYEQSSVYDLIPPSMDLYTKNETDLIALPEDLNLFSLQGIGYLENVGFNGMDLCQQNGCVSLTEVQSNWHDEIELNCEYWYDQLDYSFLEESLFV